MAYSADLTEKYLGTSDPDELEKCFQIGIPFIEVGKEVLDKSNGEVKMLSDMMSFIKLSAIKTTRLYIVDNKLNLEESIRARRWKRMIEMRDAGSLRIFPAKVPPHNASYNNGTVLFIPALPGLFVGGSRKMILTAPETGG